MKQRIVVFSGAGMSAESGINTFRDSGGLWENYNIEDVATPQAWEADPDLVTDFYNMRRKNILDASPNKAHLAIARLETEHFVRVITQNIDDLHERAGSKDVLHLHGNIRFSKSSGPDQEDAYFPIDGWQLTADDLSPKGFRLRPHVVWFGEAVPEYDNAIEIMKSAEILVVIGTSLQVYPAAGIIHYASPGCKKYIIDPNVDELAVPQDFIKIKSNVGTGIEKFREFL